MAKTRAPGLFITGTDTEVGKTYVAALIARALVASGRRVGVYKPAASACWYRDGVLVSDDALLLWEAAGRPGQLDLVCPQRFEAPLAPHLAAGEEGRELDARLLRTGIDYWHARSDVVLVEGAGGLMSPLGQQESVADVAADLGFPLVVVARNVLGTINHTLQTLIAAAAHDPPLPVAGIVLNHPTPGSDDPSTAANRQELAARCAAPVLAEFAWEAGQFDEPVDWLALL